MLKLYRHMKPFSRSLTLVMLLVLLQTLSDLYLPTLMSDLVDLGIARGNISYIVHTGAWMLVIAFGGMLCSILVSFLAARNATGFGRLLREKVFTSVESFSLHEFDKMGTATLITRTTNDINQIQTLTFMMQRMMLMAPVMCIGGIFMAVSKDRALSLVFIVSVPLLAGAIGLVMGRAIPLFRLMQQKIDRINLVLRESLTGMRVIRAFNRTDFETERFNEANRDLTANAVRVNQIMATLMPAMMLVLNFTIIAIIWFGAVRIDLGEMQVGSLMAFIQYSFQIMISMMIFSMMFVMVPRASAAAERINEVLDTVAEIKDPDQSLPDGKSEGNLEFEHVTFSFPGAEEPALIDITFRAHPGQVTAIIGGTGSGKTALISLIPRFYDIDQGHIRIDGRDVRDMTQGELRGKIGFVPQKAVLFTGTVADNIRFGKPDATDQEVIRAAQIAQADEFISGMKEGYQSVIQQGGTNVSGGQKQRLSMARALVRRPEIYIFDDSFSALDFKTDARLRAALKKETAGSTVLIVAQRVATVMDADRIIVLDEGRITAIGSHRQLMETCGVYREIVFSQLSEEELA
ncbi:MAG: ABC transporter ATP-binding protein [Solirubrobacterales bacterium]